MASLRWHSGAPGAAGGGGWQTHVVDEFGRAAGDSECQTGLGCLSQSLVPKFDKCVCPLFDQHLCGILGSSFSGCSSPDAGGRQHRVPNYLAGYGGRATLIVGVI